MCVEVAYRAIHLGGHDEPINFARLTLKTLRDNGELLADGSRRGWLTMRMCKHGN